MPAAVADGGRSLWSPSRRAAEASVLSLCGSARISQGGRESKEPRDLPSQGICPARAGAAVRLSVGGGAPPPLLRRGRATLISSVSWARRTKTGLALCGRPAPPPRLLRRRRGSAPCPQRSDHRAAPAGREKGCRLFSPNALTRHTPPWRRLPGPRVSADPPGRALPRPDARLWSPIGSPPGTSTQDSPAPHAL